MKNFKLFIVFIALVLGCSSDDEAEREAPANVVVSFADSSFDLASNFADGTVVGTVNATTNFGTIMYAIISQDPAGAIALDANNGELSILNAQAVDQRRGATLTLEISATATGEVTETATITINVPEMVEENCPANFFDGMLSSRGKVFEDGIAVDNLPESALEGTATGCNTLRVTTAALFDIDCDEPITITIEFEPLVGEETTGMLTVTEMEIPCFMGEDPVAIDISGSYDIATSLIELNIIDVADDFFTYQRFIAGPNGQLPEDTDIDNDGVLNDADNCPENANPDQEDIDNDGIGDRCDDDRDGDGIVNSEDNCPNAANPDQADVDMDGLGDVCDPINDNDCVPTVETSIWEGDLNSEARQIQVPVTGVAGCNSLIITGDLTDNFCDLMPKVTLTFMPESDGATRGAVIIATQPHTCTPDTPNEVIEGVGTYDESSQTIAVTVELRLVNGEILEEDLELIITPR